MIVSITIECEDERELLAHLSVIRHEVHREIKRQKGEIVKRARVYDSNCYGQHLIKFNPHR